MRKPQQQKPFNDLSLSQQLACADRPVNAAPISPLKRGYPYSRHSASSSYTSRALSWYHRLPNSNRWRVGADGHMQDMESMLRKRGKRRRVFD